MGEICSMHGRHHIHGHTIRNSINERNESLDGLWHRSQDDTKMDPTELCCESVDQENNRRHGDYEKF
jgi:hypothetical protein